jgi:hypothetical protein
MQVKIKSIITNYFFFFKEKAIETPVIMINAAIKCIMNEGTLLDLTGGGANNILS